MIIHNISHEHIDRLEEQFAVLTPNGWVIPHWVKLLRKTVSKPHEQTRS